MLNAIGTLILKKTFEPSKTLITKIPILKIFHFNLPIEIQTDASQLGIGGCLFITER